MAEGFAAVPTWMIRERSVPRNAILVYASLSSRAGLREIYPSQATIAEESGLSERTVRTMLKELEVLGVVSRERRAGRGAKRSTDGYRLHPNGLPAISAGSSDLPASGGVSTGNEQHSIPLIEVDIDEVDNPHAPRGGQELSKSDLALTESEDLLAAAFQSFYTTYPRKAGKEAARKAFAKAARRAGGFQVIIDGARQYAQDPNLPEKQFIPHPTTWLNQGRWEDEPLPPRAGSPNQGTAVERMAQRMAAQEAQSADWGRRELGA